MIVSGLERFWRKVDRRGPDECWPWKGARTDGGYGQLGSGATRRRRPVLCLATHVALACTGRLRPSPDHVAMHGCDNPLCVNPAHLRWGTHAENCEDKIAKGRHRPPYSRRNGEAPPRKANAKLNDDLVRYIRTCRKTTLELADELGVTNQCISRVRLRQTWAHVGDAPAPSLEDPTIFVGRVQADQS